MARAPVCAWGTLLQAIHSSSPLGTRGGTFWSSSDICQLGGAVHRSAVRPSVGRGVPGSAMARARFSHGDCAEWVSLPRAVSSEQAQRREMHTIRGAGSALTAQAKQPACLAALEFRRRAPCALLPALSGPGTSGPPRGPWLSRLSAARGDRGQALLPLRSNEKTTPEAGGFPICNKPLAGEVGTMGRAFPGQHEARPSRGLATNRIANQHSISIS